MKRWQWIAAAVLLSSFLFLLARAGTALAQDSGHESDVLSYILADIAALVNHLLGAWVSDSALTDPLGEGLASALATIVQGLADFFAQFSLIL